MTGRRDADAEDKPPTGEAPAVVSPGDGDAPDQLDDDAIYPDEQGVPGEQQPPDDSPPG